MGNVTILIIAGAAMFTVLGLVTYLSHVYNLNNIKSKTVGQGQHGTARWASKQEIRRTYRRVPYNVERWRKGDYTLKINRKKKILFFFINLIRKLFGKEKIQPKPKVSNLPQGIIVGMQSKFGQHYALVDDSDVHALMIGAAGVGKTAYFLYPNLEYACAAGMSFITSDTKGDLYRNYGTIAKDIYGFNVSVIDLRNPTRSDENNLLHLVNKYMDLWKKEPENITYKAKAEKYAKITAKTIIGSGGDTTAYGQNAFFYDAAEGLMTAAILLIAEFCQKEKRHIVSEFKLIQDLLAPSGKKGKNQFQLLIEHLPPDHKARWFAGAALNTAEQAMASVMSTALSRLNAFLDSEMEQILCFDTAIDAERFCNEKSAIFLVMPEEDSSKYFMVSLIVQQLYREILAVADENGGKLNNRVMMYLDELGTLPKIESAEMIFSASRSRRVSIVAIIQSFAQLEKNYGKEGAEIITDNTQLTIFGGFAPNSESAQVLSKALGSRTVMSGSVSRSKNDPSQSLQMIERPLMTPDELKSMKKGQFIVMKTGTHPIIVHLKLFFKWGIKFGDPYTIEDKGNRKVQYANKAEIEEEIIKRYILSDEEPDEISEADGMDGGGMQMSESDSPDIRPVRT